MSSMEINTGTLEPTKHTDKDIQQMIWRDMRSYLSKFYKTFEEFTEDYSDYTEEYGVMKVKDTWYLLSDHKCYVDDGDICEFTYNKDNTITFLTQHYNGGASLQEVLGWELEIKDD